jgi:hypothetical protein
MIIRSISEYSSSIMIMRKLPPFSAMRAFEAAARLLDIRGFLAEEDEQLDTESDLR